MSNHVTDRFDYKVGLELTRYVPASELQQLLQTFACATGLAAGIVDLSGQRITKIANQSQFCRYVRLSEKGRDGCRTSDFSHVERAKRMNDVVSYPCHTGLTDCVAVISICGRPAAFVHIGQCRRNRRLNKQKLRSIYDTLDLDSTKISFQKFLKAYRQLPYKSNKELDAVRRLLQALAVQISRRASEQVALRVTEEIGSMTSSILDLDTGLTLIFQKARAIIPFDTGSISLWDAKQRRLVPRVIRWGSKTKTRYSKMTFALGEGLIGRIGKTKRPTLLQTKNEVNSIKPKYSTSRRQRSLRCFLGVPILLRGQLVGVFEVGAKHKHAFSWSDIALLELMASQVAAFVKMVRERDYFLNLVSEVDLDTLLEKVVFSAPEMVRGKGCSVFLKDPDSNRFVLAATTGLEIRARKRARSEIFYLPGEGMTGWVAMTGRTLNVARREHDDLARISDVLTWRHKFSEHTEAVRRNRPFLAAALKRNEEVIGVIRISDSYGDNFTREDEAIIEATAAHIVSVIERVGEVQNRVVDTLRRATDVLRGPFDLDTALDGIVKSAIDLVPAEAASVFLIDDHKIYISAATGAAESLLGKAEYDIGEGVTGHVAETARSFRANSYRELAAHPAWRGKFDHIEWPKGAQEHVNSYLAVPLLGRKGVLGVLKIENRVPDERHPESYFTDEDEQILEVLATVASLAIENAGHLGEEYRKTVEVLHKMALAIVHKDGLEDVLWSIANSIAGVFNAEACSLHLLDSATNILTTRARFGYGTDRVGIATYKLGEGIVGWVAETGHNFVARSRKEIIAHPAWKTMRRRRDFQLLRRCTSVLAVPLSVAGHTVGVLEAQNRRPTPEHPEPFFRPDEQRIMFALAGVAAVLIEDVRLRADILQQREEALRKAIDSVAADTAHNIGTALHPATTHIQILKDSIKKLPRVIRQDFLEDITAVQRSCEAATEAVREIKEYSMPLLLRRRRILLNRLVRKCLIQMLGEHGPFIINEAKIEWYVKADSRYLSHVFRELIYNSLKMKPSGLKVHIRFAQSGRKAVVIVYQDNGPGVPREYKEQIFERHFSFGTGQRETGLGLYFIRKVIEAHMGSINEIGKYGSGATFKIVIPRSITS